CLRSRPQRCADDLFAYTKKHHPLTSFFNPLPKTLMAAPFAAPPGEKNTGWEKPPQLFDTRPDIGPLGVVVVTHAILFSNELEPVFETRKSFQGLPDDLRWHTDGFGHRNGRHHVLHVVHALNLHMAQREPFFGGRVTANNFLRLRKDTLVDLGATEGNNSCRHSLCQAPYQ